MPANIIKPYTSLDSSCQLNNVKTNSLYNDSGMNVDNDNSIENSDKSESLKNSRMFTLELNSSPCHKSELTLVSVVALLAVVLRYL